MKIAGVIVNKRWDTELNGGEGQGWPTPYNWERR